MAFQREISPFDEEGKTSSDEVESAGVQACQNADASVDGNSQKWGYIDGEGDFLVALDKACDHMVEKTWGAHMEIGGARAEDNVGETEGN